MPVTSTTVSHESTTAPVRASTLTVRPTGWSWAPTPSTAVCQTRRGAPRRAYTESTGAELVTRKPTVAAATSAARCAGTVARVLETEIRALLARSAPR